jgi:hypothetical protein
LGEPVILTEIQPSELSLDPIRADALIFLESDESILHIEFQTIPKDNVPLRMLDYRVRGYRKDPTKPMRQVVIYLKQTASERVYQTGFTMENTRHEFEVVCLLDLLQAPVNGFGLHDMVRFEKLFEFLCGGGLRCFQVGILLQEVAKDLSIFFFKLFQHLEIVALQRRRDLVGQPHFFSHQGATAFHEMLE